MTNYQDYQDYQEFNKYKNLEQNNIPIVVLGSDKKSLRNNNLSGKIITIALTGVITVIIIMLIYTIIKYFEERTLSNKVKSVTDQKFLQKNDDNNVVEQKEILYDMNSNVVLVEEGNSMIKTVDIFEVDNENKLQVKENFKNTPFLAIFYASWCPHCVNAAPHFQNAANKSKNNVVYFAIEDKHVPQNFPIRGYPTLYVWNGHKLGIFNGMITEEKLINTANDLFEEYESYKIETEK